MAVNIERGAGQCDWLWLDGAGCATFSMARGGANQGRLVHKLI